MEPFKNKINEKVMQQMAEVISRHYKEFDRTNFLKNSKNDLLNLELKERVIYIAHKLKKYLPEDQKKALQILGKIIKKKASDEWGMSGFSAWPLTEYVARFGLEEFDLSMSILKEMTKVFTSEWAVRSFFLFDEKRTLVYFKKWATDKNEHVRRLASEGSRPLLPWGQKLPGFVNKPELTWEILEMLNQDPSEYVRKSVANHINDHSKNHPDLVIEKLLAWKKEHQNSKEIDWIIRHGTRTLIKKGHPRAFLLHGVEKGNIEVTLQKILTKNVKLGESLEVEIELLNIGKKTQKIIADSEISLLKANGEHSIKCFKGKKLTLNPKGKTKFLLKIPFKPVTTRVYYGGRHYFNIKVNGISQERLPFNLSL